MFLFILKEGGEPISVIFTKGLMKFNIFTFIPFYLFNFLPFYLFTFLPFYLRNISKVF